MPFTLTMNLACTAQVTRNGCYVLLTLLMAPCLAFCAGINFACMSFQVDRGRKIISNFILKALKVIFELLKFSAHLLHTGPQNKTKKIFVALLVSWYLATTGLLSRSVVTGLNWVFHYHSWCTLPKNMNYEHRERVPRVHTSLNFMFSAIFLLKTIHLQKNYTSCPRNQD